MLLYFLLTLIVILLWQIHAEIQRSNGRLPDQNIGVDHFKPVVSRVPNAVTWLSRGIVAAVIIALVGCAIYINR